jgi:2,3-bisphosphoglycerate-independent phosphoglycerate mutase
MNGRVILIILDGWGLAPAGPGNAISLAETPNFDYFWTKYPHLVLAASGENVGLPPGQIGNSEVGHLNIGAGRIVWQDLPRISEAIKNGSFFENGSLKAAFSYAKKEKKPIHLIGLLSDGGVHSHQEHLEALLLMARKEKVESVYIHVFTDGRDVAPKSALTYIDRLKVKIKELKLGTVITIIGRFYAMDRDKRWDRTQKAYEALVLGKGSRARTAEEAIENSYKRGITDEFIEPVILNKKGLIKEGDAVIFYNLRSDRPRQITEALVQPDLPGLKREKVLKNLFFVTMTEYEKDLPVKIAFTEEIIVSCLAEVLSRNNLRQFHIAETEKYAHVTYFLNGGKEEPFFGENRLLVPSPKVKTYDLLPEMSVKAVTTSLKKVLGEYDFIVVNYANLDMVGHTGNIPATVKACETVDQCLGDLVETARENGYHIIITADHGNAEKMLDAKGDPVTSHTTNPVPFIYINSEDQRLKFNKEAKLGNIAPTILDIMGIEKPKEMTEVTFFKE